MRATTPPDHLGDGHGYNGRIQITCLEKYWSRKFHITQWYYCKHFFIFILALSKVDSFILTASRIRQKN